MPQALDYNSVLHNVATMYNSAMPEELMQGAQWYIVARANCRRLAAKYNITLEICAAIVAAMSPKTPWARNLIDADNLLECSSCDWLWLLRLIISAPMV
jgi:hypothetical protein